MSQVTPRFLLGALGWWLGIEDGPTVWIRGTVGPPRFTGSYTSELGREMYLGFLCVKVVEINYECLLFGLVLELVLAEALRSLPTW